jgi:hypothetical protein
LGATASQIISGYREKRRWLADNRKEEYRELLGALTRSTTLWIHHRGIPGPKAATEMKEAQEAHEVALGVILDRIFIAEEIEKANIYDLWTTALAELKNTNDIRAFSDRFEKIRHAILESALQRKIPKALR